MATIDEMVEDILDATREGLVKLRHETTEDVSQQLQAQEREVADAFRQVDEDLAELRRWVSVRIDNMDERLTTRLREIEPAVSERDTREAGAIRDIVGTYPLPNDTLAARVTRLEAALNDEMHGRLSTMRGTNAHLHRLEKSLNARLDAISGPPRDETPQKVLGGLENICAALEAEYAAYVREKVKAGWHKETICEDLSIMHRQGPEAAYRQALQSIDRKYITLDIPEEEAA